jgi:hypothetical protein
MVSNIDATKPTTGKALTADVRENFSIAKYEIEQLQNATMGDVPGLPITGGQMEGMISLDSATGINTVDAAVGTNMNGGDIFIKAAMGDGTGIGGDIIVQSGDGTTGGIVSITSGNGISPISGGGGTINISGGQGRLGGAITIKAGMSTTFDGSSIIIEAGRSLSIRGGDLNLKGGSGVTPGHIILNPGDPGGEIRLLQLPIVTQTDPNSIWNNAGVLNIGAGAAIATKEDIETLTKRIADLETKLANRRN